MRKNFFLEHPVFSIVISIVILIIGGIGLTMLPVDQYPDIVPSRLCLRWLRSPPPTPAPTP